MTRTSLFSCLAILALGPTLVACGDDPVVDPDGGPGDSGVVEVDAFVPEVDAGQDGGPTPMDAGLPVVDGSRPGTDAGDPFGDAGAPAWVSVEVLTDGTACEPLVPCGGDVVGTWEVQGGCIEAPIPPELEEMCAGSMIISATGTARGRVVFDGTTARRIAQSIVALEVEVGGICAFACETLVEERLREQVPDADCVGGSAGCRCTGSLVTVIDDGDAYSIEGNEIVSSTGKRWLYCVDGTDLRYEDNTPDTVDLPREIGIIDLTQR